jgi:hypothetical protein
MQVEGLKPQIFPKPLSRGHPVRSNGNITRMFRGSKPPERSVPSFKNPSRMAVFSLIEGEIPSKSFGEKEVDKTVTEDED